MAANDRLRVLLFLGSARAGRLAPRVGRWAAAALEARGHSVETVDPLELARQEEEQASDRRIFPMRRPYFFYPEKQAPPVLEALAASVRQADAYVMVTSEYNHAPSPALLETVNHFGGSSYAFKPSAIVTYSAGQWYARPAVCPPSPAPHTHTHTHGRPLSVARQGRHAGGGGAAAGAVRARLPARLGDDPHPTRRQAADPGRRAGGPERPGEMGVRRPCPAAAAAHALVC